MKVGKCVSLVLLAVALAGCASRVAPVGGTPRNATLKTADGPLVQAHRGSRADRTTDGKGVVEELTLAELKGMRLQNCSEPVPTFADGGGDSHVRIKGMDRIVINDYRHFANAVSVLLK